MAANLEEEEEKITKNLREFIEQMKIHRDEIAKHRDEIAKHRDAMSALVDKIQTTLENEQSDLETIGGVDALEEAIDILSEML